MFDLLLNNTNIFIFGNFKVCKLIIFMTLSYVLLELIRHSLY